MGFKIADAYVEVTASEDNLAADLKAKITAAVDAAVEGVEAKVGATVSDTAPGELRADIAEAVVTAAEGEEVKVGAGLKDDAVEGLDAEIKALIDLMGGAIEIPVGVDMSEFERQFAEGMAEADAKAKSASVLLGQDLLSPGKEIGEETALALTDGLADGLDDGLPDVEEKFDSIFDGVKTKAKESGDQSGGILLAAMAAAAAVGPAAILTGMAAATAAATADVLKSNVVIAADYKQLGTDAANSIKTAAAPLTADLNQAVVNLDGSLHALQPDLDSLFSNAGPDIGLFETGVVSLASNALPGISAALATSQADVAGFTAGLGPLGTGVGAFFTGITRDSQTTGAGIQSVMGLLGNTVGTLGSVIGSGSSAISADLIGLDPVLNTLLSSVRAISSPATIGGLAGAFGAMKLDPAISTSLGNASTKMLDLSEKTADSSGITDIFSGAALKSASALNTAAGVMSGPWGIAIGAGIGLLSGFAGSLIQATHESDTLSLSQQGLADAIAKDGGSAGATTAAYVAQSDAANGLTASAAQAGVSITTWTSAVLGNKQAQDAVTAAVGKLNQAQLGQAVTTEENSNVTSHAMGDLQGGTTTVLAHSQAVNKLTDSNQQLLASMSTQTAQIAGDITKQAQLTAATNALNSSTLIFNATMGAGYQSMVASATQAGDSAVAALNLGSGQSALNQQLAAGITNYQESTSAASGYQAVLTSLNGTTMSMDQAQNTLAQDTLNASTSFKANKYSMDLNTQAGINNRQALTNAATAITAMGVQTLQTTHSMTTANQTIQQQVDAYVKATGATGQAKVAIEQYLEQIDQIPPAKATEILADTSPAMSAVNTLVRTIDGTTAVVQVIASSGQITAHAKGGDVSKGETSLVGEEGPEIVTFGADGHMTPNSQIRTVGGGGSSGGSAGGAGGISVGTLNVHMNAMADFSNPHSLSTTSRLYAVQIMNAIGQVSGSRAGAR